MRANGTRAFLSHFTDICRSTAASRAVNPSGIRCIRAKSPRRLSDLCQIPTHEVCMPTIRRGHCRGGGRARVSRICDRGGVDAALAAPFVPGRLEQSEPGSRPWMGGLPSQDNRRRQHRGSHRAQVRTQSRSDLHRCRKTVPPTDQHHLGATRVASHPTLCCLPRFGRPKWRKENPLREAGVRLLIAATAQVLSHYGTFTIAGTSVATRVALVNGPGLPSERHATQIRPPAAGNVATPLNESTMYSPVGAPGQPKSRRDPALAVESFWLVDPWAQCTPGQSLSPIVTLILVLPPRSAVRDDNMIVTNSCVSVSVSSMRGM